jgi:SNF2 family DNA or RNA helicase
MTVTWNEYQPYGITLYKHQKATGLFILKHKRCFVFDSIGTGKTLSALSVCDFLMIHRKISKVLIISPMSVMRATWTDHIVNYFPGRNFTVLHGTRPQRVANIGLDCSFYIINTDGIKILEKEIIAKKFDVIIIDESITYASHSSARTKCAWRICKKIPAAIAMSGAPIANDTLQSYAQAKLIHYDHPKWFTKYRDQLKIKYDLYTYIDRDNAVALAYSVLQPSIRHNVEDCLDLPPMTYGYVDIKLSAEQQKHYKLMEKEYITFLNSGESVTAANAAVRYTKLLQISCGIIINQDGKAIDINHGNRLKELKLIIGQVKKVIIFAFFTGSINRLLFDIPGSEKIDGSVNERKRYDIIRRFENNKLDILICQPGAIKYGVTLISASNIVWWSPCFSNDTYVQSNGRIHRPGQTKSQFIHQFRSTAAEKRVYKALERKESVSKALLDYTVEA